MSYLNLKQLFGQIKHFLKQPYEHKKEAIYSFYNSLTFSQKNYLIAIICIFIAFFTWPINNIILNNHEQNLLYFSLIPAFLLCIGFIADSLNIYEKAWKSTLGKAAISVVFIFIANITLSLSSQIINDALKADPSNFAYTLSFVSILIIPIIILFSIYIIAFLSFFFGALYFILKYIFTISIKKSLIDFFYKNNSNLKEKTYNTISFIGRSSAIITLMIAASLSMKNIPQYNFRITEFAKIFAYNFEMYAYSHCKKEKLTKIAHININYILIGTKDNNGNCHFKTSKCNLKTTTHTKTTNNVLI